MTPEEAELKSFLEQQYVHWNNGERDKLFQLYKSKSKNGLTVEYVGKPIGDGWEEYNKLWDGFNHKVKIRVVEMVINGNEGAVHCSNLDTETGISLPSIEIYKIDNGKLHARFFYVRE